MTINQNKNSNECVCGIAHTLHVGVECNDDLLSFTCFKPGCVRSEECQNFTVTADDVSRQGGRSCDIVVCRVVINDHTGMYDLGGTDI